MMALAKMIGSHVVRWVKQVIQKNKRPYRWYDVDHCGM
jgi:hypothetical protein